MAETGHEVAPRRVVDIAGLRAHRCASETDLPVLRRVAQEVAEGAEGAPRGAEAHLRSRGGRAAGRAEGDEVVADALQAPAVSRPVQAVPAARPVSGEVGGDVKGRARRELPGLAGGDDGLAPVARALALVTEHIFGGPGLPSKGMAVKK